MIERETIVRRERVSFYFDPICPWTWITSRWLIEVAAARRFQVEWRSLSLTVLNGGIENMPEAYHEAARLGTRSLRMVEAMRAESRNDLAGHFFTELGTRLHVDRDAPNRHTLQEAARACGADTFLEAADDAWWDRSVETSTEIGMMLGGPDVGSPVLTIGESRHGIHGPVVSPAPEGEDALQLWDALVRIMSVPGFYEIKHGRTGPPQITPTRGEAVSRGRL